MPKSKNIAFNKIQHKKPPQGKNETFKGKRKGGGGTVTYWRREREKIAVCLATLFRYMKNEH